MPISIPVVEMVEGWTAYGPDLRMREYAVFARVDDGDAS